MNNARPSTETPRLRNGMFVGFESHRSVAEVERIGFADRAGGASEEWRPVPAYEGLYEVSSFGRVHSLRYDPPKVIRTGPDKDGYPLVWLFKNGERKGVALHRLVCCTFHGEKRNALHREVAHLDGDRANARADNLKWVSRVENQFHKRAHGTHGSGERNGFAKLSEAQAREIRKKGQNTCHSDVAEEFGISPLTVRDIVSGKRWKHLREPEQVIAHPIAQGEGR